MKWLLLVCAFELIMQPVVAEDSGDMIIVEKGKTVRDITDPKTKVVFHLDSDGHHLSAIRPDGTLLWEVDSAPKSSKANAPAVQPLKLYFPGGSLINFVDNRELMEGDWQYSTFGKNEEFLVVDLQSKAGVPADECGLIRKSTGEYIWIWSTSGSGNDAPHDLQDPATKITYHLDADHHHLSAISVDGKPLWAVDSYPEKSKGDPTSIKPLKLHFKHGAFIHNITLYRDSKFIAPELGSSELGVINKLTGDYTFEGAD